MSDSQDRTLSTTPKPNSCAMTSSIARASIEQLIAEYSWRLDDGDVSELATFFTEDGELHNLDLDLHVVGRADIHRYYAQRPRNHVTRHVSANLQMFFHAPDQAECRRLVIYFRGEGEPPFCAVPKGVVEYREAVVRDPSDGRWRYRSRVAKGIFGTAPSSILRTANSQTSQEPPNC